MSHTAFSMWTPEQITFPIRNNQTRSSMVTESNYEHKWSNQTRIPPGLTPSSFFFFTVILHCPVATHGVGTITENYVICLPSEPQAGMQTGAWHIWLHFGSGDTRNMDPSLALSMGCSRSRSQYLIGCVLFSPSQTWRFPSWSAMATLSLALPRS